MVIIVRAVGIILAVRGFAGFALTGFDRPFQTGGSAFLGLRLSPAVDLILLVAGYLLACGVPRPTQQSAASR